MFFYPTEVKYPTKYYYSCTQYPIRLAFTHSQPLHTHTYTHIHTHTHKHTQNTHTHTHTHTHTQTDTHIFPFLCILLRQLLFFDYCPTFLYYFRNLVSIPGPLSTLSCTSIHFVSVYSINRCISGLIVKNTHNIRRPGCSVPYGNEAPCVWLFFFFFFSFSFP